MTDYTELQKAAAYAAQDAIKFADESEEMRALQQFHEEVDPETVLALIAENEAQRKDLQNLRTDNAQLIYALKQEEQSYLVLRAERDQLRAEVAGLRTGYEAYERVNAELKAEVEGLRRDKSEPCDGCFMADAEVLRKDAGRYRWLRRAGNTKAIALVAEHCLDALDEAIDAALGQGELS